MASDSAPPGLDKTPTLSTSDASVARKRRVEKLSRKTSGSRQTAEVDSGLLPPAAVPLKKRKLSATDQEVPSISSMAGKHANTRTVKTVEILLTKRKETAKQIRYDPEVPVRLTPHISHWISVLVT
jgi:hypothetical protein